MCFIFIFIILAFIFEINFNQSINSRSVQCNAECHFTFKILTFKAKFFFFTIEIILQNLTKRSRQMFSLSAPTQPANPRMNVTMPTSRNTHTGSNPWRLVTLVKSNNTPYTHTHTLVNTSSKLTANI